MNKYDESNNLIKKGISALMSIMGVVFKVLSLFFSSSIIFFASVALLIALLLPASLMTLFSSFGGKSDEVELFMSDKCVVNLSETKNILEDYYYAETVVVDKYINDYVSQIHGVELREGELPNDINVMGEWNFAGWEEESKIHIKFSHDFNQSSQAVISYLEAIYTAHSYIEEAYFIKDGCGDECTLAEAEALMQDNQYDIENYLKTLREYKADLFYVNEGIDWTDDLHIDTWIVYEEQTKGCTVDIPEPPEEDAEPVEIPVCEEAIGKDYQYFDDLDNKVRSYVWTEMVEVEKEGLVGTIYVPVYFDAEALLKNERVELIDRMKNDLDMSETEAYKEYFDYVNGIFDTTVMLCGYTADSRLFGSSELVGVGSSGFIGEITTPIFYENYRYDTSKGLYDTRQLFARNTINDVWGRAFHLQSEGIIQGAYHSTQCTTLTHLIFYDFYGFDCGSGDGIEMAASTVSLYPDRFVRSTSPAPGAIMSTLSYNHVGFVHAVYDDDSDGKWDRIIISDGNVMGGGLRILAEYTPDEFYSVFGYSQMFAVPIH